MDVKSLQKPNVMEKGAIKTLSIWQRDLHNTAMFEIFITATNWVIFLSSALLLCNVLFHSIHTRARRVSSALLKSAWSQSLSFGWRPDSYPYLPLEQRRINPISAWRFSELWNQRKQKEIKQEDRKQKLACTKRLLAQSQMLSHYQTALCLKRKCCLWACLFFKFEFSRLLRKSVQFFFNQQMRFASFPDARERRGAAPLSMPWLLAQTEITTVSPSGCGDRCSLAAVATAPTIWLEGFSKHTHSARSSRPCRTRLSISTQRLMSSSCSQLGQTWRCLILPYDT